MSNLLYHITCQQSISANKTKSSSFKLGHWHKKLQGTLFFELKNTLRSTPLFWYLRRYWGSSGNSTRKGVISCTWYHENLIICEMAYLPSRSTRTIVSSSKIVLQNKLQMLLWIDVDTDGQYIIYTFVHPKLLYLNLMHHGFCPYYM